MFLNEFLFLKSGQFLKLLTLLYLMICRAMNWTVFCQLLISSPEGVSCVAPTNSPGTAGLPADLREPLLVKSLLVESNLLHSGFSSIHLCYDSHIFASFSSQFANDYQVDRFDFPSTDSAHLPQRRTGSLATFASGICEFNS